MKKQADIHLVMTKAFQHFNKTLFGGRLPDCNLIISRKRGAHGYFWSDQRCSIDAEGKTDAKVRRHEIAMNPESFAGRSNMEVFSTLVHEMTHLEQQVEGKPGNNGYHNKEWVGLMQRVGLEPYAIDAHRAPEVVDGKLVVPAKMKNVGTKVTHMIDPEGKFAASCEKFMAKDMVIVWAAKAPPLTERARAKTASKTKFECDGCGQLAWAKPTANLSCGDCGVEMDIA